MAFFPGLIQVGVDILNSVRDSVTKTLLLITGDVINEETEADRVECWGPGGLVFRPSKPEAGKAACQGIVIRRGDHDVCIGLRDLRGQELAGQLDYGELCLYAPGETGTAQGRAIFKKDGSVSLYTKQGNTEGGTGMLVQLDPANNVARVLNASGFGMIADADGVVITAGVAALRLSANGDVSLVGTGTTQIDGASGVLGSVAVVGVNSALTGVTGVAGKASLKWVIE